VNIASIASRTGDRYISAYAAAKHAVLGFTRCAAAEAAEHGITVNAVCPGYVDTGMTRESLQRISQKTGMTRDEALERILHEMPQRRLIAPEEVAHVVKMLCEDEARGVNGQAIGIDGGELLS
jgi:NAD(P)-dependent dehydrogenase (short-subunit alcohol dehydrogenase family)